MQECLKRDDSAEGRVCHTKVWNNNHRPERVKPAFEASWPATPLEYVDCYLIHTPFAFQPGDEQDRGTGAARLSMIPGSH